MNLNNKGYSKWIKEKQKLLKTIEFLKKETQIEKESYLDLVKKAEEIKQENLKLSLSASLLNKYYEDLKKRPFLVKLIDLIFNG